MNSMLQAALGYARLGYAVLPLLPGEKRPHPRLVPLGLRGASTDPDTLRRWWEAEPRAGLGILPPAEVLVLDFDEPEVWETHRAGFPALEAAPRQRTPRGGVHVLLRLPESVNGALSASARKLAGLDLRGMGRAYLAAAPTALSNGGYQWEVPLVSPEHLPLLPEALLARLLPPPPPPPPEYRPGRLDDKTARRLKSLLSWACEQVAAAPEGQRHNTLLNHARLIGGYLHLGLDIDQALSALAQAGMQAGLPQAEAEATARDGLRYGQAAPLDLPESSPRLYGRLVLSGGATVSTSRPEPAGPAEGLPWGDLEGLSGGGLVLGQPRYKIENAHILAAKLEGRGEHQSVSYYPLCNFACTVRRQVRRTDGVEEELLFELEGYTAEGPLPAVRVRAAEFSAMAWPVREWGARAIVAPGNGVRDHLRAAIQHLSNPEQTTVYAHTGWIRRGTEWVYLHAGGGIGQRGSVEGIEVELPPELAGFVLPDPPTGEAEQEALALLPRMLDVAPRRVTWPLLLYALGAPIGHPMGSMYIAGRTGARKTSLSLLVQALWGHTAPHPPANWEGTANALEALAFTAKDALLLVDDYAPTGHEGKQREFQSKAARLLRNQGNATGRARMRSDGRMQPDRAPRGSLLVTGEDLPPGHSVRARCLLLELNPGEVNLAELSRLQLEAARLSEAYAAWIRWLAGRLESVRGRYSRRIAELRPHYPALHGRTTDALARLHAVWEVVQQHWLEVGLIPPTEAARLTLEVEGALRQVAAQQAGYQQDTDPAERFTPLVLALFASGRAHLASRHSAEEPPPVPERWGWRVQAGQWIPQGPQVGWVDEQGVYLEPATAYAALNRLAMETGEPLPTPRTLWKRLAERGVIYSQERGGRVRHTVIARVWGVVREVVKVKPRQGQPADHIED